MGLGLDLVDWPVFFIAMTLLDGSSGPKNRPRNCLMCRVAR